MYRSFLKIQREKPHCHAAVKVTYLVKTGTRYSKPITHLITDTLVARSSEHSSKYCAFFIGKNSTVTS